MASRNYVRTFDPVTFDPVYRQVHILQIYARTATAEVRTTKCLPSLQINIVVFHTSSGALTFGIHHMSVSAQFGLRGFSDTPRSILM
jgi:hypothetical protein